MVLFGTFCHVGLSAWCRGVVLGWGPHVSYYVEGCEGRRLKAFRSVITRVVDIETLPAIDSQEAGATLGQEHKMQAREREARLIRR